MKIILYTVNLLRHVAMASVEEYNMYFTYYILRFYLFDCFWNVSLPGKDKKSHRIRTP